MFVDAKHVHSVWCEMRKENKARSGLRSDHSSGVRTGPARACTPPFPGTELSSFVPVSSVSWLPRAAGTKYPRLRGLTNRNASPHGPGIVTDIVFVYQAPERASVVLVFIYFMFYYSGF